MDINYLICFEKELEKNAFIKKVLSKILLSKKKVPFGTRFKESGKSLLSTGAIIGTIGVGGLTYGAIKQPGSIRRGAESRFRY